MTNHERNLLIESYGNAYIHLVAALAECPKEMWQWKPAPAKWSVHEVIQHIADSEANSYIRLRRFVAEPGSGINGYDENKWAVQLKYHEQDIEEALDLFKILRKHSYRVVKKIDEQTWQSATVNHSENGIMTLPQWLKIYEEHIPVHIRQIKRNLEAWKAQTI